jgi:hypothetical protein
MGYSKYYTKIASWLRPVKLSQDLFYIHDLMNFSGESSVKIEHAVTKL